MVFLGRRGHQNQGIQCFRPVVKVPQTGLGQLLTSPYWTGQAGLIGPLEKSILFRVKLGGPNRVAGVETLACHKLYYL